MAPCAVVSHVRTYMFAIRSAGMGAPDSNKTYSRIRELYMTPPPVQRTLHLSCPLAESSSTSVVSAHITIYAKVVLLRMCLYSLQCLRVHTFSRRSLPPSHKEQCPRTACLDSLSSSSDSKLWDCNKSTSRTENTPQRDLPHRQKSCRR